ncbi:Flp pilus assembly protein, ATPase CpaF [Serratia fonticola]|uniref:Flp pilus assembly protein, ATPase CpaF n=1 Tax=Serratia fonticola TaxID=47917 RepID=A0A4U9WBY1_SERFO|nr:Flp pilus assembly protein, ATPase CpaF [Serratia fonticola]
MNNSVDIELQEILRNGVLSNIDINVIEHLVTDRAQLITEMNRILERIVELQNIYLNVVGQRQMAEMMADEVIGFGPLRPLLEDDTVSDILVNGPTKIFVERFGKLELTQHRFINNAQLTDIAKRLVQKVGRRLDEGVSSGGCSPIRRQPFECRHTPHRLRRDVDFNSQVWEVIFTTGGSC